MNDSNALADNAANNLLNKGNLVIHKRQLQEGIKYPCGHCGKQFTEKGTLAKHKREVHEGIKYPCRQCGEQFTRKGNLARQKG